MVKLYGKFEKLTADKKQKIIDACIEEFAQNSYDNASTNSIVKKAGISKGLLFHYFGSKQNLFLYVFDYILDHVMAMINQMMTDPSPDIFERIMNIGLIKLKVFYEHPQMYKVLINAIYGPDNLQKEIQARQEKIYQASMPLFLEGVDTAKFRQDIDSNKAIELVFLALEGLNNKYLKMFKGLAAEAVLAEAENIISEYNEFIDILKGGVYGDSEKNS